MNKSSKIHGSSYNNISLYDIKLLDNSVNINKKHILGFKYLYYLLSKYEETAKLKRL